jgi:hypothetical protein
VVHAREVYDGMKHYTPLDFSGKLACLELCSTLLASAL